MRLKELIQQSWTALRRNPMRSSLTALGITWGVISVVLLLAFGRGLGGGVASAMGNMGNNVVVIWPGQTSMQAGGQRAGKSVHFEYADVEAIRADVPLVRAVSAESCSDFGFKIDTRVVSFTTRGVVILGYNAAKRAFQGAPAVGQTVLEQGRSLEVIGVLSNKIQDSMYMGPDNEQAFLPLFLYNELKNQRDPDMIVIQPLSAALHSDALAAARGVIAMRHHFDARDEKADRKSVV